MSTFHALSCLVTARNQLAGEAGVPSSGTGGETSDRQRLHVLQWPPPVARAAAARRLPFVFVSGYGKIGRPPEFRGAPLLEKPFLAPDLKEAIDSVLDSQAGANARSDEIRDADDASGEGEADE